MKTLNQFIQTIKWKNVGGNKTYLYTNFEGCKYGQSYQNQSCSLEDMIRRFATFYYPFYQENIINLK